MSENRLIPDLTKEYAILIGTSFIENKSPSTLEDIIPQKINLNSITPVKLTFHNQLPRTGWLMDFTVIYSELAIINRQIFTDGKKETLEIKDYMKNQFKLEF